MNVTYVCMILGTALSIFLLCSSFQKKDDTEHFEMVSHGDTLLKINKKNGMTYRYSSYYGKWEEMR